MKRGPKAAVEEQRIEGGRWIKIKGESKEIRYYPDGVPQRPENITGEAAKFWDTRVVQLIADGIARSVDQEALEAMCNYHAIAKQCKDALPSLEPGTERHKVVFDTFNKAMKEFNSLSVKFGMTPHSRKMLLLPDIDETNLDARASDTKPKQVSDVAEDAEDAPAATTGASTKNRRASLSERKFGIVSAAGAIVLCLSMLFGQCAYAQEETTQGNVEDVIPDLPQALKVRSLAYSRNQTEWALCFADSLVDQAANTHYQQEEPHNWASHTVHIFVTGQLPPNCVYTFGFVYDNDGVYQMVPVGRFAEAGRDHFSILSWGADIDAPQAIWRWSEAKQAIVPPSHPWEHTMVMFDVKPDGTLWCRYRIDVPRMFERTTLYVGHLPNASKPIQTPYIISQIPRVLKLSRIVKTSGDATPGVYPLQARYVYADGSESVTDYTLTIKP